MDSSLCGKAVHLVRAESIGTDGKAVSMNRTVSAYANNLLIAGRAYPTLLTGTSNSDTRHTDKLFFAYRTFIAALIAIKVLINIAPISMHCFAAAFADKHTAAFCTAYRAVILLFPAAADTSSHGTNRHFAIVGLPFSREATAYPYA